MNHQKKKILFIIPSLHSGGAERSLINLLNVLDFSKYDVDLFLFSQKGIFLKKLPPQVTLLHHSKHFKTFSQSLPKSCLQFLKSFQFGLFWHRLLFTIKNTIYPVNKAEQYSWKHYAKAIGTFSNRYHVAIGYLEKSSIYCCVDLVEAKRKVGFIRVDYAFLELDKKFDTIYFEKLDYLCANGRLSLDRLQIEFPQFNDKIRLIVNVTMPSQIIANAQEFVPFEAEKINLLTVGRLHPQKGYPWAVEACSLLVKNGLDVVWYVIGEGSERASIETLIKNYQLEKNFILLGEQDNPYPFMAMATIYIQPSVDEGKCNAINEAKILKKPIVATNFSTVHDQLTDHFNALIVDKKPEEIAGAIQLLLNDTILRSKLISNLGDEKLGGEEELLKFYELIK